MLRVRFAPSPMGYLHIGSARTFIFWLYARGNRGTMILRIDDTDLERNTNASPQSIFDGLKAGVLINGARTALTGQVVGPSAFPVFTAIGRERTIARLRAV